MADEFIICAAAFFRNKGKNVITENEFLMVISMDLHWMPYGKARLLLNELLSRKILIRNGEFLKPSFEISDIDVPVAYRPSDDLVSSLEQKKAERPAAGPVQGSDLLPSMIEAAAAKGVEKRDFISESNAVSKRLDIDMLAAALIILRDKGVDIGPFVDRVYDAVKEK
jgi:hypothetical protein